MINNYLGRNSALLYIQSILLGMLSVFQRYKAFKDLKDLNSNKLQFYTNIVHHTLKKNLLCWFFVSHKKPKAVNYQFVDRVCILNKYQITHSPKSAAK